MRFPFVSRTAYETLLAQLVRMEARYDGLLGDFTAMRREGYALPPDLPEGNYVVVSVDEADEDAARADAERRMVPQDDTWH